MLSSLDPLLSGPVVAIIFDECLCRDHNAVAVPTIPVCTSPTNVLFQLHECIVPTLIDVKNLTPHTTERLAAEDDVTTYHVVDTDEVKIIEQAVAGSPEAVPIGHGTVQVSPATDSASTLQTNKQLTIFLYGPHSEHLAVVADAVLGSPLRRADFITDADTFVTNPNLSGHGCISP
jgi:hypothetical protein